MLRCYGYGYIRAINPESKHFYVVTPVDRSTLPKVRVFSIGHELQDCPLLFDSRVRARGLDCVAPSNCPDCFQKGSPYVVDLVSSLGDHHTNMFAPQERIITSNLRYRRILHGRIAKMKRAAGRGRPMRYC